ncbi:MAG: hypothetical protein QM692_08105 [Thermomicrobiales bacterium]
MPVFEFRSSPTQTALDRQRRRVSVWVRSSADGPAVALGDVWRSSTTEQWHYTIGARNVHRMPEDIGFTTRETAAAALLAQCQHQADRRTGEALAALNTLRALSGALPLRLEARDVSERVEGGHVD